MSFQFVALVCFFSLFLVSCQTTKEAHKTAVVRSNQKNVIKIYEYTPKRSYRVLGKIHVHVVKGNATYGGYRSVYDVVPIMRSKAKALGADAIIKVKFKEKGINFESFWEGYGWIDGDGVAVKFR